MKLWSAVVSLKGVIAIFAFWSIGLLLVPFLGNIPSSFGLNPLLWWLPFSLSIALTAFALWWGPTNLFQTPALILLIMSFFYYPVITYYLHLRDKLAWVLALVFPLLTATLDAYLSFEVTDRLSGRPFLLPAAFNMLVVFLLWHCKSIFFKSASNQTQQPALTTAEK